jgi:hypothetical protein
LDSWRKFRNSKIPIRGLGTQTAALAFGGDDGSFTGATEEYNGATWASNPTGLNTARYGLVGAGIQTAALGFGGVSSGPTITGATEEYNGTTWASNPTGLNTARTEHSGAGTQTAALGFWWRSTA